MPYTVPVSFDGFISNISLTGDHKETAEARRKRIVDLLAKDFTILDSFPTGSIPKGTALLSHGDLDIVTVLHYGKHIDGKRPSQVLKSVQTALSGYATSVRRNGQAVTLTFTKWPSVDIVPVSVTYNADGSVKHYNVPDMNTESWIISKPRSHAKAIADAAKARGSGFLPLVRMIKEWNRVHSAFMSSYHIEVVAIQSGVGTTTNYPLEVYLFLKKAVELVGGPIYHLGGWADDYLTADDRAELMRRLKSAESWALDAWYKTYKDGAKDHKGAIELWRRTFGGRFPAYG